MRFLFPAKFFQSVSREECKTNENKETQTKPNDLEHDLQTKIQDIQKTWEKDLAEKIKPITEQYTKRSEDIKKRINNYKNRINTQNTQLKSITWPERSTQIIEFFKKLCKAKGAVGFNQIDSALLKLGPEHQFKNEWHTFKVTKVFPYKAKNTQVYLSNSPQELRNMLSALPENSEITLSFADVQNWFKDNVSSCLNDEIVVIFEWINTYVTKAIGQMPDQTTYQTPQEFKTQYTLYKKSFKEIFDHKTDDLFEQYTKVLDVLNQYNNTQERYDTQKKEITKIVEEIKKEITQVEGDTGEIITEYTQDSLAKETDQPNVRYFEAKKGTSYPYDGLYHLTSDTTTTFEKYWAIREQIDPEIALEDEKKAE